MFGNGSKSTLAMTYWDRGLCLVMTRDACKRMLVPPLTYPPLSPFSQPKQQFTSVLILYALLLELTAQQYLWADMGVVLGLVVLVPTMKPKPFLQRGTERGREGGGGMSEFLFLSVPSV